MTISPVFPKDPGPLLRWKELNDKQKQNWNEIFELYFEKNSSTPTEYLTKLVTDETQLEWIKAWLHSMTIYRFCVARDFHVRNTQKMLNKAIAWRISEKPHLIQPPIEENKVGKTYLIGRDKEKRPLMYMRSGRETSQDSVKKVKTFIFWLEYALEFTKPLVTGLIHCTFLIDFNGYSPAIMDPKTDRSVLELLVSYYPEVMGKTFMIDAPSLFRWTWIILNRLLPSRTRQKIHFCSNSTRTVPAKEGSDQMISQEYYPLLCDAVDPYQIEQCYHGKFEFIWDDESSPLYWKALADKKDPFVIISEWLATKKKQSNESKLDSSEKENSTQNGLESEDEDEFKPTSTSTSNV